MGGGNQSIYGQGGSASADFYGNAPVGSMGNTGVDYTQYDPGDYARSSELGSRGAANYNQGPFQVQKFGNDMFNLGNFGL